MWQSLADCDARVGEVVDRGVGGMKLTCNQRGIRVIFAAFMERASNP